MVPRHGTAADGSLRTDGIDRYRISSIEPDLLTDEIIAFTARSSRFLPHFHIPLQSGCDEVLKLMKRHYERSLFAEKIRKIKEMMPDAFIGVDVIVGTNGETEEYFNSSYEFLKSLDVTQLHVFSYSERPNTQALKISGRVRPEEKKRRSELLHALSEEKRLNFYRSQVGKSARVLWEEKRTAGLMHGFTENYLVVERKYDKALVNRVTEVTLGDVNADGSAMTIVE